ncbi:MAG: N-acetylneuraminate synthase [Spirochaetota bacterium]|nr:MAG: N-acetylneuraminate synthase [Spirochaetota bacterium]
MSRQYVFIIAEGGVNHNGSLETAINMIDAAAEAGADACKFQTFNAERIISRFAVKAEYQKRTTSKNESQLDMVKKLELGEKEHKELVGKCKKRGIMFLSSAFDIQSVEFLDDLGIDTFKIPSGEITNLPYLRKVGSLGKKVILSTGMATLDEVRSALRILTENGTAKSDITVLHCNTEYPTPIQDVNLRAMVTIKETFNVKVGYSDHTNGTEVAIAAAALGASVIEKHFTLDRSMEGPDHSSSLEPDELKYMVTAIRNIEKALGDSVKTPSRSEIKNIAVVRKSIVASRQIQEGEQFTEENITVKRPGEGISPMEWDRVIGRRAKKKFKEDEYIEL